MKRTYLLRIGASASVILLLLGFQNCSRGFQALNSSQDLSSLASAKTINVDSAFSFSSGYQPPNSKQGIGEFRMSMSSDSFDRRYQKLQSLGTGYRQYNLWWSALESSGIAGSSSAMTCPSGYQLIPANETERTSLGYHHYHCINQGTLSNFDNLFQRDQLAGIQSGVVLWSSPAVYRYADCVGFNWAGSVLKDGCVPRDDAMDDFEDYINLVASRYSGGANGKISHFIIWNENASPDWFDYSPMASKTDLSSASVEKRIDKCADMLKRVHAALMRHQQKALMYVSTDLNWAAGKSPGHFGTQWLLDGLWVRLGVNYSWSVAVHPYGNVDEAAPAGTYSFNNLEMVVNHQVDKLKALGVINPLTFPQSFLIASEQGWPITTAAGNIGNYQRESQARQICLAHNKVMSMSQVIAVAHSYFHSVDAAETSSQGSFYGLIPYTVPDDLSGMESTPTGAAFVSTLNGGIWAQHNDHYCCQTYGLGCIGGAVPNPVPSVDATHPVLGIVDGFSVINGSQTLSGWACVRSVTVPTSVHLYVGGPAGSGQFVGVYSANVPSENAVNQACGGNGPAYRFQIPLSADFVSANSGRAVYVYGISTLGLANVQLAGSGSIMFPFAPTAPASSFAAFTLAPNTVHLVTFAGKCLDVIGASQANGSQLQQWDCNGYQQQSWGLAPTGSAYQIYSANSGKCLDVTGGSQSNGTLLQQYDCNASNVNQLWNLSRLPSGAYILQSLVSGKCVDVTGASTANGTRIQQWDCNGYSQQSWQIQ